MSVRPKNEYEVQNWNEDIVKRGKLFRQIINPDLDDLLVYYPGSAGETIISRFIGARVQVQVNKSRINVPNIRRSTFNQGQKPTRREYMVQWLNVVDYHGDAFEFIPPEIMDGVDVFIDKCWAGFQERIDFKTLVYNKIREKGYLITDKKQGFFDSFDPEMFGLEQALGRDFGVSCSKGGLSHLRVYRKWSGLHLPREIFDADLAITQTRKHFSKRIRYPSFDLSQAKRRVDVAIEGIEDRYFQRRLRNFSESFFRQYE